MVDRCQHAVMIAGAYRPELSTVKVGENSAANWHTAYQSLEDVLAFDVVLSPEAGGDVGHRPATVPLGWQQLC
jgi:hypothetical protein